MDLGDLGVGAQRAPHVVERGRGVAGGERRVAPVDVEEGAGLVQFFQHVQELARPLVVSAELVGADQVGQQRHVVRLEFEALLQDADGLGEPVPPQQDDAVVVDRLVEVGGQPDGDVQPALGGVEVAGHQSFGAQVVVVVAGRREIRDRPEVAVGRRPVGQEVVGRHLAVHIHSRDHVPAADHDAVLVVPALVVLDFHEERIQPPLAAYRHEQVDEGEAVARRFGEGLGRRPGRRQGVLQVHEAEDEVERRVAPPGFAAGRADPFVDGLAQRVVDGERHDYAVRPVGAQPPLELGRQSQRAVEGDVAGAGRGQGERQRGGRARASGRRGPRADGGPAFHGRVLRGGRHGRWSVTLTVRRWFRADGAVCMGTGRLSVRGLFACRCAGLLARFRERPSGPDTGAVDNRRHLLYDAPTRQVDPRGASATAVGGWRAFGSLVHRAARALRHGVAALRRRSGRSRITGRTMKTDEGRAMRTTGRGASR